MANVIKPPPLSTANASKLQALFFSVESGNIRDTKRLLSLYGFSPVVALSSPSGSTVLHKAALRGDPEVINILLSYDAVDINQLEDRSIGGYAAIHICCQKNKPHCLQALISAGADINRKAAGKLGETPMHICCKAGWEECGRVLIDNGADLTLPDGFGHSPSFWAYSCRHLDMIGKLGLPPPRAATAAEHLAATGGKPPTVKKKKKAAKGKGKKK